MSTAPMEFHPAAAIFSLLEVDSDDFQQLVDSIRKHGLKETIKTHEGKIIDGRNRKAACAVAGVEPRFEKALVNGSAADYVYAMNFNRRHLTDGAKQLAAGRYKEEAAREAKERMLKGKKDPVANRPQGKSRDVAAAKFDVKPKAVDAAAKVLRQGSPEVINAVDRGEIKVTTAARLVAAPKSVQTAAVKEGNGAIRKAIEKHTPSLSEEARNDAGVRWSKSMREILRNLNSTRELGGIEDLTARWTPELITQYRDDIAEMIEELETWKKALTAKLQKR